MPSASRARRSVRSRRKRVRGHDHLVARADPEREDRDMDRGRPGRHRDRMLDLTGAFELGLELGDLLTHGQHPAFEHLGDRGGLLRPGVRPC
jgi:hypothetical protein